MTAFLVLLALSALAGLALGGRVHWLGLAAADVVLAVAAAFVLHLEEFDTLPGIATIAACLTVNQACFLAGEAR
jgi:hypothetical protein